VGKTCYDSFFLPLCSQGNGSSKELRSQLSFHEDKSSFCCGLHRFHCAQRFLSCDSRYKATGICLVQLLGPPIVDCNFEICQTTCCLDRCGQILDVRCPHTDDNDLQGRRGSVDASPRPRSGHILASMPLDRTTCELS